MVFGAHRAGVALFMCNALYPARSYRRDGRYGQWRQEVMRSFGGALVKSDIHAERFSSSGLQNVVVTGEPQV